MTPAPNGPSSRLKMVGTLTHHTLHPTSSAPAPIFNPCLTLEHLSYLCRRAVPPAGGKGGPCLSVNSGQAVVHPADGGPEEAAGGGDEGEVCGMAERVSRRATRPGVLHLHIGSTKWKSSSGQFSWVVASKSGCVGLHWSKSGEVGLSRSVLNQQSWSMGGWLALDQGKSNCATLEIPIFRSL